VHELQDLNVLQLSVFDHDPVSDHTLRGSRVLRFDLVLPAVATVSLSLATVHVSLVSTTWWPLLASVR
jgi:hypothetical protein